MIKLAIDAMGGDFAPEQIVKGVNLAIKNHKDLAKLKEILHQVSTIPV